MKLLKYISHLILISIFMFGAASCSESDKDIPAAAPEQEENYNLEINVPFTTFGNLYATRADGEAGEEGETPTDNRFLDPIQNMERSIHNLYIVIFHYDPDQDKFVYLRGAEDKIIDSQGSYIESVYTDRFTYRYEMMKGSYRFYILANILDYWDYPESGSAKEEAFLQFIQEEDNIRSLVLNFSIYNTEKRVVFSNIIPMACMPEDICYDNTNTHPLEDGIYEVTDAMGETNSVYSLHASMSLLCSKVRLTVLFDKGEEGKDGFSKDFPVSDVDFSTWTYSNIYNNVKIVKPEPEEVSDEDSNFFAQSLSFKPSWVTYPDENKKTEMGYFDISSPVRDEGQPVSPVTLIPTNVLNENKRAWQQTVYLPENLTTNYTKIHLAATGSGVKDAGYDIEFNQQLKRGYFYDVVAKLTTSTACNVAVKVHVNPWQYVAPPSVSW